MNYKTVFAFTSMSNGKLDALNLTLTESEKEFFMFNRNDPEMTFIQIEDIEGEEFTIALDKLAFVSFKKVED